jgi:hypothetical protein
MSKKCPHCGGTKFKAVIKRAGAIDLLADGSVTIIKELEKFSYEVIECLNPNCKAKVTNDDLVDNVACSQCGTMTKPEELSEDGLCPVCAALKARPELASASPQDLIRMLIEAERRNSATTSAKIEKKVENAETTVENVKAKEEEAKAKAEEQAAAPTDDKQEDLTPQQKAAQTRKLNAEKKKLEEEALAAATAQAQQNAQAPTVEENKEEETVNEAAATTTTGTNPMDAGLPTGDGFDGLPTDDSFQFPQFGNDPF